MSTCDAKLCRPLSNPVFQNLYLYWYKFYCILSNFYKSEHLDRLELLTKNFTCIPHLSSRLALCIKVHRTGNENALNR